MAQSTHALKAAAASSENSGKFTGLAVTIALHAGVLALLLQLEPVRSAITQTAPIMVSLISPPRLVEKPDERPKPLPVKPRVQRPQPVKHPPVLTVAPEAPAPAVAPPPPPAPPAPAKLVTPATPSIPVAVAAPPVVPPDFNASYLNNPAPAYPALSRRMREEGKVVLRVFVNEQGLPTQVQVKTPSGFTRLDGAALETVRQWKFVPARRGETPVGAWVLVPISFSLRS